MNDYIKKLLILQANDFAKKYSIKLHILDKKYQKFWDTDNQERWVFRLRLSRNRKSYTFKFGQSIINDDQEPTMYDVLTCIVKCDPEDFDWFCSSYGYDTDSRRAYQIYQNVKKEWKAADRLFGDILDELEDINFIKSLK